jgi:hypothetical protein
MSAMRKAMSMTRRLVVTDGRRERELLLIGTMVVGRDPTCDISDADPLLSPRHVEFVAAAKEVIVRDLGSRNGILINGVKAMRGVLHGGDVVQVGHLQVRFVDDDEPTGVEEPTERVARPGYPAARFAETDVDRTVPVIASDQEKPRFAGPAVTTRAAAPAAAFVMTQTVSLAAIVFIATATPLIVWPPATGEVAIVLAAPLIITMGAVWVTSRRIHRHLSTTLTSGGAGSARSAGREI